MTWRRYVTRALAISCHSRKLKAMRRLFLFAAVTAALAFVPAAATAGTHHPARTSAGSSAGPAKRCTYNYDWSVLYSGGPQYARANWDVSCGLGMQTEAICYNADTNTSYGRTSGVVYALGKWDTAFCVQGDSIESGWIRFYNGTGWSGWHRFWVHP